MSDLYRPSAMCLDELSARDPAEDLIGLVASQALVENVLQELAAGGIGGDEVWVALERNDDRLVAVGVPDWASRDTVSRVLRAHGGRFMNIFGRLAFYRLAF